MERLYFTFGSSEQFPYQNGYLVVESENRAESIATYQEKYPNVNEGCVNCSFIYTEKQWFEGICKNYEGKEPKEILLGNSVKVKRLVPLLENAMEMALEAMSEDDLLKNIGTTKKELEELGVQFESFMN